MYTFHRLLQIDVELFIVRVLGGPLWNVCENKYSINNASIFSISDVLYCKSRDKFNLAYKSFSRIGTNFKCVLSIM